MTLVIVEAPTVHAGSSASPLSFAEIHACMHGCLCLFEALEGYAGLVGSLQPPASSLTQNAAPA